MTKDNRIAVVSTSINERPRAYAAWAEVGDLIVAGDLKTPPELPGYIDELGGTYLSPDDQRGWQVSDVIGWNCIQRRNTAILNALSFGYEYLTIVDDDNYPKVARLFGEAMIDRMHLTATVTPMGRVWNPGALCAPRTRARGVPLTDVLIDYTEPVRMFHTIGIVASLWEGDPDIDAVERMANNPEVGGLVGEVGLSFAGGYAPVNSQSTSWERSIAMLAAVPPHLGRMDDIWGGYIAQRILREHGIGAWFGHPRVEQIRNEHDLTKDFDAERIGYQYTVEFVTFLDALHLPANQDIPTQYVAIAEALAGLPWFPDKTVEFMLRWVEDVEMALA